VTDHSTPAKAEIDRRKTEIAAEDEKIQFSISEADQVRSRTYPKRRDTLTTLTPEEVRRGIDIAESMARRHMILRNHGKANEWTIVALEYRHML
jgi:uncharacterized protein (DUF2384 family)